MCSSELEITVMILSFQSEGSGETLQTMFQEEQSVKRLEISDLASRGIVLSVCLAKTKTLISCAVTAQLICIFVFAYAKKQVYS